MVLSWAFIGYFRTAVAIGGGGFRFSELLAPSRFEVGWGTVRLAIEVGCLFLAGWGVFSASGMHKLALAAMLLAFASWCYVATLSVLFEMTLRSAAPFLVVATLAFVETTLREVMGKWSWSAEEAQERTRL